MSKRNNCLFTRCAAAAAALFVAGAAQAVDLRDWGRKFDVASERFAVLASFNDEAVLDKETQLVWQRKPVLVETNWGAAMQTCRYSGTGGRFGWRLPSFTELMSLLDSSGALPAGNPFYVGANDYYWSSTDLATNSDLAYIKRLPGSGNFTNTKVSLNRYLCVRGVGAVDRN